MVRKKYFLGPKTKTGGFWGIFSARYGVWDPKKQRPFAWDFTRGKK